MNMRELVGKIENLRQVEFFERSFFNSGFFHASETQREKLLSQGNRVDNWNTLYLASGTLVENIQNSWFRGLVRLDLGKNGQIWQSVLEDVEIAQGCRILQCPLVRRTVLDVGVILEGSYLDCRRPTSYGVGIMIGAGIESVGRVLFLDPLRDFSKLDPIYNVGSKPPVAVSGDFNYLGADSRVRGACNINGLMAGPGANLENTLEVHEVSLYSTKKEPVYLGPGTLVRQSILHEGVRIDSGAQVVQSQILAHGCAERGVWVTQSLLGPDSHVAEGEITASILGPFVGFHHQSLLIAAWWPQGRGNVASGAQVGSNHTSRLPDQEIKPGEGMFFGLATVIKFPADFTEAPYTVVASGVTTLPQKLGTPFSLIVEGEQKGGLGRLIPGWVLSQNVYGLIRNEFKFAARAKSRSPGQDFRVFRPEIVDKLWKTLGILEELPVKAVYTSADCALFGANVVLHKDWEKACLVYREFYEYGVLRIWAQRKFKHRESGLFSEVGEAEDPWVEESLAALETKGLEKADSTAIARRWWEAEKRVLNSAIGSLERDWERGSQIISDYANSHSAPGNDPFIVQYQKHLELWSLWI